MKKGISIWSFQEPSLQRCFQLAKEAGFDGVELSLSDSGPLRLDSTTEEIKAILDMARREGIALYSIATDLCWKYSLTDNDPEIRAKSELVIKKQIDAAAILECDTVLVVPGMVTPEVSYDTAYARAMDAVKRLAGYAEEKGIIIGVENVWNKLLLSPLEMKSFIDEIGSPFVKVYFDVGNVILFGYPQHWIRILGDRIVKIHFKDYRASAGTHSGFVDLLSGDVNYIEVIKAFEEIGYDGWVTGEVLPHWQYPESFLKIASLAMDHIITKAK